MLIAINLGDYLGYLPMENLLVPKAYAQAGNQTVQAINAPAQPVDLTKHNELGIIAILAEKSLMDDFNVRSRIMTYASSVQKRIPHSKSVVLEVDKNESTFRIASLLEKLYFEGINTSLIDGNPLNNNPSKQDNNKLTGVILIGNIPIPVVHEENALASPSIYPYVDFYEKKYIYNHGSDQFEANSQVSAPEPEIWHGLIIPPSKDPDTAKQQLIDFFDKNYQYTTGNPDYSDFENRVLYANFPEMQKQMNFMDYRNYLRYLKYMEEMVMNRFNKHLLKQLVKDVSADMGSPDKPIIDDKTIDGMYDVMTENIFNKYAVNLADALKIYRSGINQSITKTGRWTAAQVDSPESLITLRDEYAKNSLKRDQLLLEKDVNDFVGSAVNASSRSSKIVTQAQLNVKLKIADLAVDSNTFTFLGYFDGQPAKDIQSTKQCGMEVGQKKADNESVLDNNSVLVKANRMYDPASLIQPPNDDSWVMEDDPTYKAYGGCVFNNSIDIPETGNGPSKCVPELAYLPLFDIIGSKETDGQPGTGAQGQCELGAMTFKLPTVDLYDSTAVQNPIPPNVLKKSLKEVIDHAYADFQGANPGGDPILEGSFVIQHMLASGQPYSFEILPGVKIELNVSSQSKPVDTLYSHVEPTNDTIKAIEHIGDPRIDPSTGEVKFPQITTPSTPTDGVRFLSFARNGIKEIFKYLDLFRISGNNPGTITADLFQKIDGKQKELDVATGVKSNVHQNFLAKYPEMIEPIVWRAESIDQKLSQIITKYTDRDSFMPTPYYNPRKSPQNKPEGYEVLHVVADGDAQGYEFGLNRAMLAKTPQTQTSPAPPENAGAGTGTGGPETGGGGNGGGGGNEQNSNYVCGDPNGVEIWQWFDSLQCWINKEILPADQLFSLSQQCSQAPQPPEEATPPADPLDAIVVSASSFKVEMKRQSLVSDETEKITVTALDAQNKPVMGYIDMPIHFSLSNSSLGQFAENDVYIYSGEKTVDFTAKTPGTATLTVKMGQLPEQTFTLNVYDKINLDWNAAETLNGGRSEFMVNVGLKAPNGSEILNVNDSLQLAPTQPADGGFENGGYVTLTNGKGQIKFIPTPGRKTVTLMSKDPSYNQPTFVIHPTGASASQLILRTPSYIQIGKDADVQVIAADSFGYPATDFNKTVTVTLDDSSKNFVTLTNPTVTLANGKGTLTIKAGGETGDVKLTAKSEGLTDGTATVPLLARVDSSDINKTYPQTLFASFVGFPGGDFTQENYFGGTQLFSGKTEAVYSFLTGPTPTPSLLIGPNHLITTTALNQAVYVEFPGNQLLLQVFDQKTMQTLFSKRAQLNFDSVQKFDKKAPAVGTLTVDILDTNYLAAENGKGFDIKNVKGDVIASLQPNKVTILDPTFKWSYQPQPEFNAVELTLTDGLNSPARILLAFKPVTLKPTDFDEINPNLQVTTLYGGKSTNDPTGLVFADAGASVPETTRDEFYGIQGQEKYISLFASGTNIGDAVKFKMPVNAILLGDPTIKLKTKSLSSLNFNSATGQQIYEDPEGKQVVSINHLNFNNDGYEDVALLTKDGRVRLLEGGPTEPSYVDKGNIAFLADGGIALETLDLDRDHYDDLLVATEEGRLAILHNNHEVITRTDQKLNIGKKIYQLLKGDMDQDGYDDLVVLDSRGDIYIFYYDPVTKSFPENGQWIANYGFSLKLNDNLNTDLDIRYGGMPEPAPAGSEPGTQVLPGAKPQLQGFDLGSAPAVDTNASQAFYQSQNQAAEEAAKDPAAAVQNSDKETSKLPWPENGQTETYFAPVESIGSLNVIKNVANKDRPGAKNVDLQETLTYTIEINPSANLQNVVLADTVPDSLTFQPDSVKCVQGCDTVQSMQNSVRVFFSGLNLTAGKKVIISYDAQVAHTPAASLLIQKITEPNENLPDPYSIIDKYLDILVSPPYNNTGKMLIHYSTGPRSYAVTQTNDTQPKQSSDTLSGFSALMKNVQSLANGNYSGDNPPENLKMDTAFSSVLDQATGNKKCLEDASSFTGCTEAVLDDIGNAIADFSCMGGGCFPMPYNMAFLVPPRFPLPVFAFPTTLPTPVGPIPFIWPGSIIGAANITGPIMSMLRFYLSPTLTGGIGLAMCWGPYPTVPTVPPPVWPIPYPPPIGNCMVTALPGDVINKMFGGLCTFLRDQVMQPIMDAISAGVNKINSTVNDINNNPNIPVNVQQGGPAQGAGGMEISLGVNLGNSMKFNPPAKSFSNIHINPFDSIGGVISGWFDRQTLEIKNKLLTLPTFTIFLPDVKSLFSLDWEKTKKRFEQWKNTLSGVQAGSAESRKNISEQTPAPGTESETVGQWIRGGLQDVKGGKFLQYMQTVQTQASVYNLNALQGLYDAASTLPLVKLTEDPIQFDIPWLSAAEIQGWITDAQNWVIYYEREYARVKDKWEKLSCSDQPKDEAGLATNTANCVGRQIADAFGVNFDPLVKSVKDNIEVLQSYLNFPKQLVKFKQQLAGYIKSVACMINVIAQMMGGWFATIRQQMVAWAELILTIVEIVKRIKEIFDLFVNFDSDCSICTNERYANWGWWMLLGLILPDIPIISFPKIPDVVLDLSNLKVLLDIELPILELKPKSLPLPPLPYIRLPDIPSINLLLTLPPLPVLPKLPNLPDLPALPPIPVVQLPTLPAPPKLPDIGKAFQLIVPIVEKILQIWCIMKKSLAPVPEMMLNDQITLLTNRPAYLIPLDILKIQLPNIALFDLGFNELRIETIIYLGLKIQVVSKTLEDWAKTWNGWMAEVPKNMNKAYQKSILDGEKYVQGKLDEAQTKMNQWATNISNGCIEFDKKTGECTKTLQDEIDEKLGAPLAAADKWLRDREKEWQKWADSHQVDWTYEKYYSAINNLYSKIVQTKNENVKKWFDDHQSFIDIMNYIVPFGALLDFVNQQNLGNKTQDALDFIAGKLKASNSVGPTEIDRLYICIRYYSDCRQNETKYFGTQPQSNASTDLTLPKSSKMIAQTNLTSGPQTSNEEYAKKLLQTTQGQQMKTLVLQMADILNGINKRKPVDYTVLKKQFGIPNYQLPNKPAMLDKLNVMQNQLNQYGDRLLVEADGLKDVKDLNAIAGVPAQNSLPFKLAEMVEPPKDGETKVFTGTTPQTVQKNEKVMAQASQTAAETDVVSKQVMELQKTVQRSTAESTTQESPVGGLEGSCKAAVCLPDPITKAPVPVIPYIDAIAKSETLFMPNGHLIYDDGTGVYLKRDLTVNDEDQNTDTGNPQRFDFNEISDLLHMAKDPKEAVNMFQTTFTEDGASTFTWLPSTHPDVYGYGIELERTIDGFNAGKENDPNPDTKIVLLPPDSDGMAPVVTANGEPIDYGTLVTSLTNKDQAAATFGIDPRNIVTGVSEIHFPSINNAMISLTDKKAVYFDQLNGSAFTMNMENGYYHIKMTWFDKMADTATYNENELLAPQVYAGATAPIDVSQTNTYYVPVFKEKKVNASDIFVDLQGAYNYYWYINPDANNLTPEVGKTLTIPAQTEAKQFKVKLVATQNVLDSSFQKYEKTFNVVVYVPSISLDSKLLNEGVVAGNMQPIAKAKGDDLTNIPFSVFRKRLGEWKNIGILRAADTTKKPTFPALGANQSYYSIDSNGTYNIEGFDLVDPAPIVLKDKNEKLVAVVSPETGLIDLKDSNYELQAVPGGTASPTRVAIVEKTTRKILANVVYAAASGNDVTRVDAPLTPGNEMSEGVTVGDDNTNDDVVAGKLPDDAPSFPGGVAIYEKTSQINVAMVSTDGTVRMMKADYSFRLKNPDSTKDKYVFQIADSKGKAVYDIFIAADFKNLKIGTDASMNNLNTQLGMLDKPEIAYADSPPVPNFELQSPVSVPSDQSPFKDVPKTNPYYQQILDLYKSRVISGYSDGSFRPDQRLTRAEFVKIALGVTNCVDCSNPTQPEKTRYSANPFPDVSLPAWYYYCIAIAKELKMVTGYGDGFFRPDREISRAEAAAILLRQSHIKLMKAPKNAFLDVPDYAWYVNEVYTAVQIGLIKSSFGLVNPDEPITRGEFAFMAEGVKNMASCRLVDSDKDGMPDWYEMTHGTDMLVPDIQKWCPCYNTSKCQADTDKDGVKDVCDIDIDNDGVLNPLCILDDNCQVDQAKLAAGTAALKALGERTDNCIFIPNPDQKDSNGNGIGDACEVTPAITAATCPCINNPNKNDTDKDGIPDVCDDDIDNDGIKNPICLFDASGLFEYNLLPKGADNCPFIPNPDQKDTSGTGIGDACNTAGFPGKPALPDKCPDAPEDMDGVQDQDGCPEVTDNHTKQDPGVYVNPGELCSFVDFGTDMKNGDAFMTAITDLNTHTTLMSKSAETTFTAQK